MKKLLIFALLSALILVSCGGGNRKAIADAESADPVEETDFFVFDLEGGIAGGPRAATFNELIDSIRYIPLETHPDGLMPAEQYYFTAIDGNMFIAGGIIPSMKSPILQFDSLGRFVKQVTYHGRGPNEILVPMEWYANPNLKQINVISTGAFMVVTSTDSGERWTINLKTIDGYDRIPLNDSTFVSSRSVLWDKELPKASLFFIDRNGNTVHWIERTGEKADYAYRIPMGDLTGPPHENYKLFPDYKGDAIFHDIFNDTLYRVKSRSEITPHLVFRRGALFPDQKDVDDQKSRQRQVYFAGVKESGDHVFLNYYYDGRLWCEVWSKRDGNLMLRHAKEKFGYNTDVFVPYTLPDGTQIELQVLHADRDHVYCILEALDACKFLPGVGEEDNPVIVVAKLKQ